MPQPHEDHVLQETVDAIRFAGGNKAAAARNLGIPLSTLKSRSQEAQTRKILAFKPVEKPRIRVPARSVYQPEPDSFAEPVRVFVWGCAHDAPNIPDKSRFAHAGKLAAELRPHYIVDLGDSLDLDSLSAHPVPGSVDDRQRPFFTAEMDSLTEAYAAFHEAAPSPDEVPRYHLHGNHEYRAFRHEANSPASQGVFTTQLDQVFARMGWTIKNYREWLFLNGVGFTHVPLNIMGREIGGVNANQTVSRESTFSVVWSHTHKREMIERPKFGIGNGIQVYNSGSFMPQGYLKQYAGLALTGWSYGVSELTLRDGQIESARYWSTRELEERYA